jgi:hypothetical protein
MILKLKFQAWDLGCSVSDSFSSGLRTLLLGSRRWSPWFGFSGL